MIICEEKKMETSILEYKPQSAQALVQEVMEKSGQNLASCYQCRRCAAGCPVGDETGYVTPDRLIRMIVMGSREAALNNLLVWKCVSCYTCGTRCPNEIQTGRITETLKQMAKEEDMEVLQHRVKHFHDAFVSSALRWGRVNEFEFMGIYEIKNSLRDLRRGDIKSVTKEFLAQAKFAMTMMKKRRMHFGIQVSGGRKEFGRLMKKSKQESEK